ncbi:MAG TPA: M1 family aminopeptidase, partial [Elusimicrobiales bacterium]|nr:M1 family aminopeptidase [Elusimicrobiales bacterium]
MKKISLLLLLGLSPAAGHAAVRHELSAALNPARGTLAVADTLTFDRPATEFTFSLHKGLGPAVKLPGASVEIIAAPPAAAYDTNTAGAAGALETYRVKLPKPAKTFKLEYAGEIKEQLAEQAQEYARSFSETTGLISEKGCYLSAASGWYPVFENTPLTYRLETRLPDPYQAVAGGARTAQRRVNTENVSVWEEKKQQDEINLVCGKYREYARPGRPDLYAFLLTADDELAGRYLDAAAKYARFYADLLGPYPYAKFALVENFWETGYGMPSFTLLGSKVIRLPFIINSSYPHEILHNWWGNGVFVDYASGNWCEGLTAYLADYLIAENRGKDRDYRAATLQKYAAYVRDGKDFPLTDFRGRHSSASEAVGYGKALMFYHMLRLAVGDAKFTAGLRAFYAANLFRAASFEDLRRSFEKTTGLRLDAFFSQWLRRAGAPELAVKNARVGRLYDEYELNFTLTQRQDGPPYALRVPVRIYLEGVPEPRRQVLDFNKKEEQFNYSVPGKILRLEIDPEFDVFRRLSPLETPPGLAGLLGAKNPEIILPGGPAKAAWETFAAAWTKDQSNLPVIKQSTAAPAGPHWVLGADNALAAEFKKDLEAYGAHFTTAALILDNREFPLATHTFVFADYHPANPAWTRGLVISPSTAAIGALAVKLPHYGKYSWLVFDGAMNSAATGVWPSRLSPLTADFSGGAAPAPAAARQPLARLPSAFSAQRMAADIAALSAAPGGRGPGSAGLKTASAYIEKSFKQAGLKPFNPGPAPTRTAREWKQTPGFVPPLGAPLNHSVKVEGFTRPGEYLVLSAHYDRLAAVNGQAYPGADDNASGTALLLELARYYAAHPQARHLDELATRSPAPVMSSLLDELDARYGSPADYLRAQGV